ncbi:hypothetical protein [Flavonifractor sp. An306]|uniref:hypothetical protein n=1 Tax=Flavonifractor sp. An306 TaxID=1965629 RepID=UPI0013A65D02|nr:hypothetical protein [Flavonifractor sp. An306]
MPSGNLPSCVCYRAIWTVEDGEAVLLTGRMEVADLSGQPVAGYNDGPFAQAAFSEPWAIVPYDGGFLVSDTGNHVLRYLDLVEEKVCTGAGTGRADFCDGTGEQAAFDSPTGLAVDNQGTVYIADTGNGAVYRCQRSVCRNRGACLRSGYSHDQGPCSSPVWHG